MTKKYRYCPYAVRKKPETKEPVTFEWGDDFQELRKAWKQTKGGKRETIWFHAFDLHCERRCKGKWGKAQNKCEIEAEKELDEFLNQSGK